MRELTIRSRRNTAQSSATSAASLPTHPPLPSGPSLQEGYTALDCAVFYGKATAVSQLRADPRVAAEVAATNTSGPSGE